MKKQTKKILVVLAVIIAIISLIMISGKIKLPFATYGEGLIINSMSSNIVVISEDTDLKGVWWLINAQSNGGQSILGTITPEDTQKLTGYTIEYPLEISASALDEKVEYVLKNTGEEISYFYSYTQTSSDGFNSDGSCKSFVVFPYKNAPVCPSGTQYEIPFYRGGLLWTINKLPSFTSYVCWRKCITKKQSGVISLLEPSRVVDSLNMTLKARGETITKTISQDNPNIDFVSPILGLVAQVQYPSSGWTGNYPPSGADYKGFYGISDQKWRLTSNTHLYDYRNTFTSVDTNLRNWASKSTTVPCNSDSNCYNTITNEMNRLLSKVNVIKSDDMSLTQNSVWANRNDQNTGKIIVDLDRQLAVANLIIKVRADWLGIKINVGKPQIVGKSCDDFKSGDNGKIDVQVKNIGSAKGSFVGSVSCGVIKQSYSLTATSINPRETKTISIPIDAGTFADEKYDNCEIRVQDFNKESNYDTSSAICHILKPALCVEGDFYLENNCIKKCIDGIKKQLKCCEIGQTIIFNESKRSDELGGYYCSEGGGNGGINPCSSCDEFAISKILGPVWKSKQCQPSILQGYTTCALSFIKYILMLIVLIFGTLFGKDLFAGINSIRKYVWLHWILALITSLILAYLIFIVFWIGIVIFIIYIVLRLLIGGKIRVIKTAIKRLR